MRCLSAAHTLAGRLITRKANASCSEEPGAGILQAGICEEGAGQPVSLPRPCSSLVPRETAASCYSIAPFRPLNSRVTFQTSISQPGQVDFEFDVFPEKIGHGEF
jgi:hypothetical protein